MNHSLHVSTDRPREASAEFRIGLRSVPYLADHGFQDLIVLPGSFYIDMALRVGREYSKCAAVPRHADEVPVEARSHVSAAANLIRNVTFQNPIILAADDTVVKIDVRDHGGGRVEYTFYEAGVEAGRAGPAARRDAATLEIDTNLSDGPEGVTHPFSIGTFQSQSRAVMDSARFYRRLRENGNQYGHHFQNVSAIWRANHQSLGKISLKRPLREPEPYCLHPSLLDSITQLLASFIMEKGKAFVLRAIEKIRVTNVDFPETLWGHATVMAHDAPHPIQSGDGGRESGLIGNVRVFDQSGKTYLELSGVAFTLLDRIDAFPGPGVEHPITPAFSSGGGYLCSGGWPSSVAATSAPSRAPGTSTLPKRSRLSVPEDGRTSLDTDAGRIEGRTAGEEDAHPPIERESLVQGGAGKAAANLVIAANFTAEPVEDSLKFWGDYFGVLTRIEFAPYNQIFQQLLDAKSPFRKNSEGANVILLALEEWAASSSPHPMGKGKHGERLAGLTLDKERAERCFGPHPRYVLPNGLEIVHLNQYETDYLYQEIFEDECYLRHGIGLPDGATVVDIGANIGLFSLFVMSRSANAKIFALEPAPVVYELLQANCRAYGSNVQASNVGVSDRPKTATFTFYEKSSVFSGFHSDETEDREAIQTVVRNMLNRALVADESVEEYVNDLTADRLRRQSHECRLTSVSDIIRDHQIEQIDLLKIDAEKSELDIIRGIADGDWRKIEQIVIEIHDRTGESMRRIEGLLSEKGYRCIVEHEKLLEHSGLFNLYATRRSQTTDHGPQRRDQLEESVVRRQSSVATKHKASEGGTAADRKPRTTLNEFCAALRTFMNQSAAPLVLCVCPRTPTAEGNVELKAVFDDAEQALLAEARTIPNVHTVSSAALLERYPVRDYYDPHSHQAGHIPYTAECFAAIGTALVRALFNLKRNPFKVIVLDCDNTLWKGICGEDGPRGIELTEPYRALQEFMVAQMNAGRLLCLCSKNNEKDVLDVFDHRADMPLKREHLVSWRINWNSKADNLKSLAHELNLGLNSFIFVDDNPVDCADVRIRCPDVLTLQLPRNTEVLPLFLNHVWAFDQTGATEEDHNRTKMYQESMQRQKFRERTLSLNDFVKGLRLRVEIAEAADDQLVRVSQLTYRTNQFNFTTIRRSENEIREFLKRDHAHCLVVRVADRFGDYGLVGVVMYETESDRYKVDTFLLSCRVLGRGVEHAVVSHLGQRAAKEGKRFVEIGYQPTEKNGPALKFITSLGNQHRNEIGTSWTFPAECLARVEYDADENTPSGQDVPANIDPKRAERHTAWLFDVTGRSECLQRIGEDLCDVARMAKAIEEFRIGKQPRQTGADIAPGGTLETALLNIWRQVFGRPRIGMTDNFFEAGGTSLRAVQVIALIKKELKQNLSIVTLFECPTVSLLAAKLSAVSGKSRVATATAGAVLRGQQRRCKTTKQIPS